MPHLPHPITGAEEYLKAIYDRLGEMLDVLRAPAPAAELSATIELKEPAAPKEPKRKAK